MSKDHIGGYITPTIEIEEHRSVNGVHAKAVIPYSIPTATELYDYSAPPIYYVGTNNPGALTSDSTWTINKFDLSSSSNAKGQVAYNISWDGRTGATYS